jgi:hypothetical protein
MRILGEEVKIRARTRDIISYSVIQTDDVIDKVAGIMSSVTLEKKPLEC